MAAGALLPPLLPTPPRSKMLPLLPTPDGLIFTMLLSAMPGRADFVQRWDSIKKYKKSCSSICSSSSSSSSEGDSGSTGRADFVDRWDTHKNYKKLRTARSSSSSSYSAGSPGRAGSVDRWDSKKLKSPCGVCPLTDRRHHDGNNKRLPSPSGASSAERWDLHKKSHPEQMGKLPRTNATKTATENAVATLALATTTQHAVFAGSNFHASPEPSMLPMPSFLVLAH